MLARAYEIIDKAGYSLGSDAEVRDARLVITAHNRRALERLRRLLGRDPIIRSSVVVYQLREGPEELDPPIVSPRAASLIILDSLAAHYAGSKIVGFDVSTLPKGISTADVVSRGLRLKSANEPRCYNTLLAFLEPRAWVDGRIQFHVDEPDRDRYYDVWCTKADCRMRYGSLVGSRDVVIETSDCHG